MSATIRNRAEAAQMQIEIMKWEAWDAFITLQLRPSDKLTAEEIEEELESIAELAERKPKHLARAWEYLQSL